MVDRDVVSLFRSIPFHHSISFHTSHLTTVLFRPSVHGWRNDRADIRGRMSPVVHTSPSGMPTCRVVALLYVTSFHFHFQPFFHRHISVFGLRSDQTGEVTDEPLVCVRQR